ncbi:hypothetical protein QYE76_050259 [Lolium multiflorum]|uniref:Aminotransferase-like plant mobile domain-containing protein n=1 Tax=Lolium multiflorum TaxID=4521 RepID=A0AAD8SQR2_LOLMU|nr:hypothetical protein QYE76_050259 [Lolium multiflorum]
MNATALTALVDRWRPETHTFHLRAGEMTPTLQDVSMILGLPIQGEPLCMNTTSDGWRGQMEDLIGRAPPPPEYPKDRTPAGALFLWIRNNFGTCPQGANRDTIKTYTRVYLCTRIELVNHAYDDDILDDPIEFDENTGWKLRRLANMLGCREGEIAATSSSEEAEIPDDTILSQSITRGKKQATRYAYQLKPRGNAPNRYTPDDYVNRGKKVVIESDVEPARRSALRMVRNDEPSSSEEEEQEVQQQEEQRHRTKRMVVRKQPVRRGRRR